MDGFKRRLNESVQLKLSVTLSVVILVVAVVAGVFSFFSALGEAHELQDDVLRQVAQIINRQHLSSTSAVTGFRLPDVDEESRVIVQRLDESKPSLASVDAGGALPLPATLPDGLHTLDAGGETFRVLVKTASTGERFAVAQEAGFRNEIARDGALRTVMPLLILVFVLLLMVTDLVRKMFRPIAMLSREVDQRAEQDLHPIDVAGMPGEVRPFLEAINGLLARVKQSMDMQRRFLADAAHELRSPFAALSLQSERLSQAEMSDTARERLKTVQKGIERGRHLLEQLLTMARVQAASPGQAAASASVPVSLLALSRQVIEDFISLAQSKDIDLGMLESDDAVLCVDEMDILTVVKNLVDNAIRYSPRGSRVDLGVRALQDAVCISVCDQGPGIPEAERERVFDPFYRVLGTEQSGSGLGLAIVKEVAGRLGASVNLAYTDNQAHRGLTVTLRCPIRTEAS